MYIYIYIFIRLLHGQEGATLSLFWTRGCVGRASYNEIEIKKIVKRIQ